MFAPRVAYTCVGEKTEATFAQRVSLPRRPLVKNERKSTSRAIALAQREHIGKRNRVAANGCNRTSFLRFCINRERACERKLIHAHTRCSSSLLHIYAWGTSRYCFASRHCARTIYHRCQERWARMVIASARGPPVDCRCFANAKTGFHAEIRIVCAMFTIYSL